MGRLLLWDIDGTLLTARGVSKTALYAAAVKVIGREFEDVEIDAAGKTDPQIVRELVGHLGVNADDVDMTIKKILRAFGPEFAKLRREIASRGEVFAGVREVMTIIDQTRTVNTVLTGNIAVNAVCKLDTFSLTQHFDLEIGGYGSDSANRNALVDVVLDRASDKRRKYFAEEEIWIIGDTPLDYAAAKDNGIRCLLVANGRHSFEELSALGADAVMPDLTDTQALVDLLLEPIEPPKPTATEPEA